MSLEYIYGIGNVLPEAVMNYETGILTDLRPKPAVSIIVATYGYSKPEWVGDNEVGYWEDNDDDWNEAHPWEALAKRACKSARRQQYPTASESVRVIRTYGETLAAARNEGARKAESDWLIFLDADDELDFEYVDAMRKAALVADGDIFKPATLGVYPDGSTDKEPVLIPKRNLLQANHIVIGAMVRRDMFLVAGGFRELPALEDWDLWLRLALEFDAKIIEVPNAIYRVHVNNDGRNSNTSAHRQAYLDIVNRARPIAKVKGISVL